MGQLTAKMAKLRPDMTEIDPATIRDNIVTEKEHHFHEGGYMVKRNGIYYFIYSGLSIHDFASCISYSTSKSPWGPFKYGGIIINNDHSDPKNWNNHGSIVEFQGKWYVFYHRATHGSNTMRKACVEPITFNDDGSIDEVEMTTQGAWGLLDARQIMDAERACLLHGDVRIEAFEPDNEALTGIKGGDKAAYKYLDPLKSKNMIRRDFIRKAGLGSLGTMSAAGMLPEPATNAVNTVPEMKIKKIDVVRDHKFQGQNLQQMWVRLYTDNGIVGVGETYWNTNAQ